MDALDREILSILQLDGRATMTDVAAKVGLSLSACHRRFRDLEASGVIRGYSVDLNLNALGFGFEALVFVTMHTGNAAAVTAFEAAVAMVPSVVQAHRLFGEPDYQLHVVAQSQQHYQELYDQQLSQLPGVRRLNSTLVMKTVVARHPVV